jgi:hypothetical protein
MKQQVAYLMGPDVFDRVAPIEQWILTGQAPATILAAHRRSHAEIEPNLTGLSGTIQPCVP